MKLQFTAAALAAALVLPLSAQAQTEIQWWHALSGPLVDWVGDLA
jgi:sn-glycerol 3-phosphate transport system substrate-binding protein